MRQGMVPIFAAALCITAGCTHMALERRTVKQASTLTDLQYQQVLDNVAMFACNPEAMPWHVKIKGGTVQIADQGSGAFGAEIFTGVGADPTKLIPGVGAQRGILNQWDVDPAVETDDLELLRLAYRKAIKPLNPADTDLEEDIRLAIWQVSLSYEVRPGLELMVPIVADAVKKNFEVIRRGLQKAQLLKLDAFEATLKNAEEVLVEAIEDQQRGSTPPERKEAVEKVAALKAALKSIQEQLNREELQKFLKGLPEENRNAANTSRRLVNLLAETKTIEEKDTLIVAHLVEDLGDYTNEPDKYDKRHPKQRDPIETKETSPRYATHQSDHPIMGLLYRAGSGDRKYFATAASGLESPRNPGLVNQARDKVDKLYELLTEEKLNCTWYHCGCKKDVPKCACYVGHYCSCGRECYVWVMPEQLGYLREFTLLVLGLAPPEKQEAFFPRGAAFSPALR